MQNGLAGEKGKRSMEEDYIKIQCPECGQVQQTHEMNEHNRVECSKCKKRFIAIAPQMHREKPFERPLPGKDLATLWNFLGWLLLAAAALTFGAACMGEPKVFLFAVQLALCSMGPFSIAAIIRAINANTLEIRKLGQK
jgi:ribosomal protein S27E